jgi:drug/metabolite transporter (DMT)-like permease
VPALIASCALVWAHWQHHRLVIAPRTVPFVIWDLTGHPLAAAISKMLLRSWNPISLELVRSGTMAIVLGTVFAGEIKKASLKVGLLLLITNALTSIALILFYFSYQWLGIVHTMLLFSLQPVLVYIASLVLLREKFQPKKLIAFCIVLACIIVAQTMTARPRDFLSAPLHVVVTYLGL